MSDEMADMNGVQRLGYDRGASDRLAGRPSNSDPPREARGSVREYRKFYRKGYGEAAVTGAFGDEIPVTLPADQPVVRLLKPTISLARTQQPASSTAAQSPAAAANVTAPQPTQQSMQQASSSPLGQGATTALVPPKSAAEVVSDWLGENWKYVAAGVGVVVVGAVAYSALSSKGEPEARRALPPPPPMR